MPPRRKGFSSGKRSRAGRLHSQALRAAVDAAEDNGAAASDAEPQLEPQDEQPAPKKHKPTPRGEPKEKPKQKAVAELSPESAAARRKRDAGYARTYRANKRLAVQGEDGAPTPIELPGALAYALKKSGEPRKASDQALRKAKSRAVSSIDKTRSSLGGHEVQAQALHDYCESHPAVAKAAGFFPEEEVQVALFAAGQRNRMLERAAPGGKAHANASHDQRSFVAANMAAIAPSPKKEGEAGPSRPSQAAIARSIPALPKRTAHRLLAAATERRGKLSEREAGICWSLLAKRKGHRKVTGLVRKALFAWIRDHPRVVPSPITNDTLLVMNEATGQKERVGKLLLEIPVRELHNDLIELPPPEGRGGGLPEARDESGKIVISETALRSLVAAMKILKPMTQRHKMMCGCEICIVIDQMQRSLNTFRVRLRRKLIAAAEAMGDGAAKDRALQAAESYQPSLAFGAPWHLKPTQALGEIQCAPIEGGSGFPHWSCVERSCKCCPAYPIPPEEQGEGDDAPRIKFHVYEIVTTCSHHGAHGTVNGKKKNLDCTYILN